MRLRSTSRCSLCQLRLRTIGTPTLGGGCDDAHGFFSAGLIPRGNAHPCGSNAALDPSTLILKDGCNQANGYDSVRPSYTAVMPATVPCSLTSTDSMNGSVSAENSTRYTAPLVFSVPGGRLQSDPRFRRMWSCTPRGVREWQTPVLTYGLENVARSDRKGLGDL